MTAEELFRRLDIGEDQDIEFKSAKGGLPKDTWPTVSAFANTAGGYLIFGIIEKKHDQFDIQGIKNLNSLRRTFWDGHNNRQKLSTPICNESNISIIKQPDLDVMVLNVPRADRKQRPVFINGNPLTGTYKRNFQGDYRCSEEEVRQMLRDASNESQDSLILEHFEMNDLDVETIKAFRNRFASREPDHPFLALDDKALLERLGGWRRDRKSEIEGLTLAGLLMFGQERSILDAFPGYHLDYQEKHTDDPEERWSYRLTLDGRWEPNLFNFYFRVYPRLVDGLNVPFKLDRHSIRLGETHVHEAIREALVNTLIHADHSSTRAITIIKRPNMFIFANPGRLRIPLGILYSGGVTDPRNPSLQKMFQMLGLGEKAGSGFQKILRAWREQHWLIPLVADNSALEMTRVNLPLASMIPKDIEKELREIVGGDFGSLTELDRIIMMLAHKVGDVTNADIQPYRKEHPREIGDRLKYLLDHKWLERTGQGRGTRYRLPGKGPPGLFPEEGITVEPSSEHYKGESEHYKGESEHYNKKQWNLATHVREKRRIDKKLVRQAILELCSEQFMPLRALSELLNRSSETIRTHYLNRMIKEGVLELRFPDQTNNPKQAYKKK